MSDKTLDFYRRQVAAAQGTVKGLTETERALASLRSITDTTGMVHDLQLQHLGVWGRCVFNGAWTLSIDQLNKIITFRLLAKARVKGAKAKRDHFLFKLEESVNFLFGDKWRMQVYSGDNLIWAGAPVPNVQSQRAARAREDV